MSAASSWIRTRKFAVSLAALSVAALLGMISVSLRAQAVAGPELKPELSSLAYFAGDWECSGKFDSSGKAIDAHQHFVHDLNGAWLLFLHVDKFPFRYHALADWGWDA